MSKPEIPLLRESTTFAARLVVAAGRFAEPTYYFNRRVNWSYRYGEEFYAQEADCFREAPEAYLEGHAQPPPELADVYAQRLRPRQVTIVLMKTLAHWLFLLLGRGADRRLKAQGFQTYRKCYVDDIELVFDPAESSVVRAVYPFPINLQRQLRYLAFLRRERLDFKLAGNPYLAGDLIRFIIRRDVRSLMRMESRAQILHASQVARLGMRCVQLSDEFDIGSLDFTRRLARTSAMVVNSAHGVGKYLPMHAYGEFRVLTLKQQQYYHATRECKYTLRQLNDRTPPQAAGSEVLHPRGLHSGIDLVFLSQSFAGPSPLIAANEAVVVARLRDEFEGVDGVRLLYKPHPNSKTKETPAGFARIPDLQEVNGREETLFVSFFSTCQIDPAFKGRKVLLRGNLIYPAIAFDDSERILAIEDLVELVKSQISQPAQLAAAEVATAEHSNK